MIRSQNFFFSDRSVAAGAFAVGTTLWLLPTLPVGVRVVKPLRVVA